MKSEIYDMTIVYWTIRRCFVKEKSRNITYKKDTYMELIN
jgi:hypothetical protein